MQQCQLNVYFKCLEMPVSGRKAAIAPPSIKYPDI